MRGGSSPQSRVSVDHIRSCIGSCIRFSDGTVSRQVLGVAKGDALNIRLSPSSTSPIVDFDGRKTSPREWAERLNVVYRPGVVFFNEGKERVRMDGMQYHYHFKELLRYVSGKHYRRHASFSSYNAARREELLQQGVVIDYSP